MASCSARIGSRWLTPMTSCGPWRSEPPHQGGQRPSHCCSPVRAHSHGNPTRDAMGLRQAQTSNRTVGSVPLAPHQSRAGGRAHRKCHIYPFAESSQGQEADTELTPTSQGKDKSAPIGQAQGLVFLLVSPPYLNSLGATSLSEKEGSCFKQNSTVMSTH